MYKCKSDNFERSVFTSMYRATFQDALKCTQASRPSSDALFMYTFMMRFLHFLKRPGYRLMWATRYSHLVSNGNEAQFLINLSEIDRDLQHHPVSKRVSALVDQCAQNLLKGVDTAVAQVYGTPLAQAITNGRPDAWQPIVNRATALFFVRTAQASKASVQRDLGGLLAALEKGIADHFESAASSLCMAAVADELIEHLLN